MQKKVLSEADGFLKENYSSCKAVLVFLSLQVNDPYVDNKS
jgi:hypothetical protein